MMDRLVLAIKVNLTQLQGRMEEEEESEVKSCQEYWRISPFLISCDCRTHRSVTRRLAVS